jgi:hypothetical protein
VVVVVEAGSRITEESIRESRDLPALKTRSHMSPTWMSLHSHGRRSQATRDDHLKRVDGKVVAKSIACINGACELRQDAQKSGNRNSSASCRRLGSFAGDDVDVAQVAAVHIKCGAFTSS